MSTLFRYFRLVLITPEQLARYETSIQSGNMLQVDREYKNISEQRTLFSHSNSAHIFLKATSGHEAGEM
ncbi:hypothetical protein Mapa_010544 [Marchantia paleacea]|nr:hypothetical protein Mapa_010544 [Marchantia paleacea]